MIKRAFISGMIALIAAVLGYGGFFETSEKYVQTVSFAFLALCGVSLLLSLFEEDPTALPVSAEEGDPKTVQRKPA